MTELAEANMPPPPLREGIPREVVAWLRSLHLPRVVRHPKRDLSNGFLVALICSRYWSSISMHSYEDKLSVANKRRNWELLQKQLALNNCPLSDRMVDGMIACSDGYAESFLRQLYTQLTGRVVVEAAPFPAEEVTPPQRFNPHSSQRMTSSREQRNSVTNSESTASAVSRLRGIPTRSFDDLKVAENGLSVSFSGEAQEKKTSALRTISRVGQTGTVGDGNNDDGTNGGEHTKPPVDFAVSLRRAEVQKTVSLPASQKNEQKLPARLSSLSLYNDRKYNQQQVDVAHTETTMEFIESTVRAQANGLDWPCADDAGDAAVFTEYFLREEMALGALLQCRIWSVLLSSVPDVAKRVFANGSSLADVSAIFLGKVEPNDQRVASSAGTNTPELWRCTSPSHAVPNRYAFLGSLLANMSECDVFLTVSAFCSDVLPHAKAALQALDYSTADSYAFLICSVLPAEQQLATELFPSLISSVYVAITESSSVNARCSFYILLRALLLRVAHGSASRFSGSLGRTVSERSISFVALGAATDSTQTDDRLLSSAVLAIAGQNIITALSHESAKVRLVGAHLAGVVALIGCPSTLLFGSIVPLLSTCCTVTSSSSVLFSCVCAGWLQSVLKCVSGLLVGRSTEAVDGGTDGEKKVVVDKEVMLCLQALPYLAAVMNHVCGVLQKPVSIKARVHIAEQLALCLNDIPSAGDDEERLFFPEKVAVCVFAVFKDAPASLVNNFFFSPSPVDPRARGQSSRSGQCAMMHTNNSLLGPLSTNGMFSCCYPLALSEAVIAAFQADDVSALPSRGRRSSGGDIASVGHTALTQRHTAAKATALLHDRSVPDSTAGRITWLYKFIVASRGNTSFPEKPASLGDTAAMQRWNSVLQNVYRDIAIVVNAAEMLLASKSSSTESWANTIVQMAGMAQQIVVRWYMELQRSGTNAATNNSSSFDSIDRVTEAMEWYHCVFGGIRRRDQPQHLHNQQQQARKRISTFSGRNLETGTM